MQKHGVLRALRNKHVVATFKILHTLHKDVLGGRHIAPIEVAPRIPESPTELAQAWNNHGRRYHELYLLCDQSTCPQKQINKNESFTQVKS